MRILSRKTRAAIAKYGETACVRAFQYHEHRGYGAAGILGECDCGYVFRTVGQVDAAINAGREIQQAKRAMATEPLSLADGDLAAKMVAQCAASAPNDLPTYPTAVIDRLIKRYQAVQKQHGVDSSFGRIASEGLKPLFEEMARRQRAGTL